MPKHAEKKRLPYSAEQMFDLVADVGRYPEFLPWCRGARVRRREGELIVADLVIGFKGITERFTSRVELDRDNHIIDVSYEDGPFKYLENHWKFIPDDEGCVVDFYVDFEFRSRFLQHMIGMVFTEAVRRMVNAFETRARDLYG
ncbi:MAG: type II toxin-antitoxin system RatA family toxin [Marivibrio sp.]|uniref:type II toxin-antitoxin system RatA family toxin n=1 Tax=Marivibrio sp. TaxID=2039719 RepID=UPI0032EAF7EE